MQVASGRVSEKRAVANAVDGPRERLEPSPRRDVILYGGSAWRGAYRTEIFTSGKKDRQTAGQKDDFNFFFTKP